MSRSVELHLGINGGFCAGRWERPANWMRLTKELGFDRHEFSTDVLDPFYSGDFHFQMEQAQLARAAAHEHGVEITGVCTGIVGRRFHGLSHSDPIPRQRTVEWLCQAMDVAVALGTKRLGGRWDGICVEVLMEGEHAYNQAIRRQHEILRDLCQIAADKGLSSLQYEQSCTPLCTPWTFKQAEELLIEVNRSNGGCPLYLTINVGEMAGQRYGLEGREVDYREWLRRFGAFCEVVHLQQTTPDSVRGWPFTEEFNALGHVRIEAVLEALQDSHQHAEESWVSEVLPAVSRTGLVLQVMPQRTTPESQVLEGLKASSEYLRQYVPDGRVELSV